MIDRLSRLLEVRPWLLADGATGTNYFALGLASGEAPESWLLEQPERVKAVHRRFVEAGSDVILTNSFGGTRHRLKLHGLQDRVVELNRRAAELARDVADAAGREVVVGGSIGPTGELIQPLGALSLDDAVAAFAEQAEGLKRGGADVAWIETMSAAEEMEAAVRGVASVGLPYVLTASFDTNGRTMMGVAPEAFARLARGFSPQPIAIGSNCGIGPADLVASVLGIREGWPEARIIAKGNCGIPVLRGDAVEYGGTPELMSTYARLARDAGARIIGGCCGTSAAHLCAMRDALDGHVVGRLPAIVDIEIALGPIARPKSDAPRERRTRRER